MDRRLHTVFNAHISRKTSKLNTGMVAMVIATIMLVSFHLLKDSGARSRPGTIDYSLIKLLSNLTNRIPSTTSNKVDTTLRNNSWMDSLLVLPRTKFANKTRKINISYWDDLVHYVPDESDIYGVFPKRSDPLDARIFNQLAMIPPDYNKTTKLIVLPKKISGFPLGKLPKNTFKECPVNNCHVTYDVSKLKDADMVVFKWIPDKFNWNRPSNQIWVLGTKERPHPGVKYSKFKNMINWTATYRTDSTIPAPYDYFVEYEENDPRWKNVGHKNYASGKTKKVAWMVSNCNPQNQRDKYAKELQKYIEVDIYGKCGTKICPRNQEDKCLEILKRDYKFYLAFENNNCFFYITEKLFRTALGNDVIPIVMGARREDYLSAAPRNSLIFTEDFESPEKLAKYLHLLDSNDYLYNKYFEWKGSGEFIDHKFWCRACAMLNLNPLPVTWYNNIEAWWEGKNICTDGRWDEKKDYLLNWQGTF